MLPHAVSGEVGVTIDCAPVLDLAYEGAHSVIGSRAYSRDPARAAELGRAVAEGLLAGAVAPVRTARSGAAGFDRGARIGGQGE